MKSKYLRIKFFGIFLTVLLTVWSNTKAKSILLTNTIVHTVSGPTHSPGFVLIDGDKIKSVGPANKQPQLKNIETINLKKQHLFPGIIATTTALGLMEIPAVRATVDTNEVGVYTPEVKSWLAINPDSELIPVSRANGITHFLPTPQGGTIAGQSGLMRTVGWGYENMIHKPSIALHLYWPKMNINLASEDTKKQTTNRDKRLKEINEFFEQARAYLKSQSEPGHKSVPAWNAMTPWVRGEKPIIIHANTQAQIESAVQWASKLGWKVILAGGRDAWRVAGLLAKHKISVIYEHTFTLPPRDFDRYDVQFRAAGILHKAGVKVIFSEGLTRFAASNARNVPYSAAQSATHGLPVDIAHKGITQYAAEALGVADRLGSIEPGKEATFFSANGDILEITTQVKNMWIKGEKVDLSSRHTRLYKKYQKRPKLQKQKVVKYPIIQSTPQYLKLSSFYKKSTSAAGLPVVSSENVSDLALKEAAYLVEKMIGHRKDIINNMIKRNCRLVVMGHNEFTTQIPEYSHFKPAKFWDRRARGFGSDRDDPVISCAEENLLCYPGDPYNTESIMIHEFAHAIHLNGIFDVDTTFDNRLKEAYEKAISKGLWKEKYASNNHYEYWAEGVQSWFDTNRPPDHDHNHVDNREELKAYDPELANLVKEVFGETTWRYQRPSQRKSRGHLEDFNTLKSPTFKWPKDINEFYLKYIKEQAAKDKNK
ncbi:MAG: amidohydrolase family protein [Verrucomicrobiota bacterium]|nr:amidohydrolase family protein [Verrucomicrobiota bacterium]